MYSMILAAMLARPAQSEYVYVGGYVTSSKAVMSRAWLESTGVDTRGFEPVRQPPETKEPPLAKPCNCAGKEAHTITVFDGGKPAQEFIYVGGHLVDVVRKDAQPVFVPVVEYRGANIPDPAPQLPMPAGKMPEIIDPNSGLALPPKRIR